MVILLSKLDFSQLPQGARLLLGEGSSETGFLFKLATQLNLNDVVVGNIQGETKLGTALKSLTPYQGRLRALGLMFDANADSSACLNRITNLLNGNGFTFDPNGVDARGVFRGGINIGVFLSPGGNRAGRIENLVLEEVRSLGLWNCLEQFVSCVGAVPGHPQCNEKSIVQIAISALEGGVCGIGTAFKRNLLDVQHAAYGSVANMVSAL